MGGGVLVGLPDPFQPPARRQSQSQSQCEGAFD